MLVRLGGLEIEEPRLKSLEGHVGLALVPRTDAVELGLQGRKSSVVVPSSDRTAARAIITVRSWVLQLASCAWAAPDSVSAAREIVSLTVARPSVSSRAAAEVWLPKAQAPSSGTALAGIRLLDMCDCERMSTI
jgi:hypothetical protein